MWFWLQQQEDIEPAWALLDSLGFQISGSETSETGVRLFGSVPAGFDPEKLPPIVLSVQPMDTDIDWNEQWNSKTVSISWKQLGIERDGEALTLIPGPGFGDSFHPTTNAMLQLMKKECGGKVVMDIGCGSGILSLCALALGAKKVIAVDIDPSALEHTRINASRNEMDDRIWVGQPYEVSEIGSVVLLNMIQSEQEVALRFIEGQHLMITSGILQSEEKEYLEQAKKRNWTLVDRIQIGEWLGFKFLV